MDEVDTLEAEVAADDARMRAELVREDIRDADAKTQCAEVLRLLELGANEADPERREVVIQEVGVLLTRAKSWGDEEVVALARRLTGLTAAHGIGPWTNRAVNLGLHAIVEHLAGAKPGDDLDLVLRKLRDHADVGPDTISADGRRTHDLLERLLVR